MIAAVSVRKLKPGVTFEQFREAWQPDEYPEGLQRVYHARSLQDPDEILSIGILDAGPEDRDRIREEPGEGERQARMAALVESASVDTAFEIVEEIAPTHAA